MKNITQLKQIKISSKRSEYLVKTTEIKKLIIRYTNQQTKDYKQLTDMPTPDQFKPTKNYVLIVCYNPMNNSKLILYILDTTNI